MTPSEGIGSDRSRIDGHLRTLGMSPGDHARIERLHELAMTPRVAALAALFLRELDRSPPPNRRRKDATRARLRRLAEAAIGTLGRDFDTPGYFALRARAGAAHFQAGIALDLYIGAHYALAAEIVRHLPEDLVDGATLRDLVHRLVLLEVSIVASAYQQASIADLDARLSSTRAEAHHQRDRARRDSLTSIFNRGHLDDLLSQAIHVARRTGTPLSVAMIDLDHFKKVNDRHGHSVGDVVLRDVVARMSNAIRETDWLGRYGGDEFVLILQNAGLEVAGELVERLRAKVSGHPIRLGELRLEVSLSAGVAALEGPEDASALLARADAALYRAKLRGRDRVSAAPSNGGAAAPPAGPAHHPPSDPRAS